MAAKERSLIELKRLCAMAENQGDMVAVYHWRFEMLRKSPARYAVVMQQRRREWLEEGERRG
jgi:hypothetical protein